MKTFTLLLNLIFISKIICEDFSELKEDEDYNSYFDKSSIESIDFKDFKNLIDSNVYNDYLILFTVRGYEDLEQMLKLLEESIEFFKENKSNITFYKVDMIESYDLTILFHFEDSPKIVYISKGKYSIYPQKTINKFEIKKFIEDKNKVMIDIPKDVKFEYAVMKLLKLIIYVLPIKYPILDKIINLFLIAVLIILIFIFISIITKICCPKIRNILSNYENQLQNQHQHQHHHHHHSNKNKINRRRKIKVE